MWGWGLREPGSSLVLFRGPQPMWPLELPGRGWMVAESAMEVWACPHGPCQSGPPARQR